jgi:type I restriction enzyme S subunit
MWQGSVGYSEYQGISSPAYVILKPKMLINPKFYHYMFRSGFYTNFSRRFSYGIVDDQLSLRYSDFKRMYSIVPPLETQNKIVEYLDKKNAEIDKFIKNKERLIELFIEEFEVFIENKISIIKSGWQYKKIKYFSKVFRGKFTHRPRNDESLYDGEYPFIQTGDVARANKYINEYNQTLNKKGFKVTNQFPSGTIVMTIAANIGDVAMLGFKACFPDSIIGFYPKKEVMNDFLYYALKIKRNDFLQTAVINTQMNLNVDRVSSIFINIPSRSEQERIVNEIEVHESFINKAISKAKKEISSIKEYREALITDLVTGRRKEPE